jgi:hypothetical protein
VTAQDDISLPGDLVRLYSKRAMSFVISPSDIGRGLYINVYLQSKTHVLWGGLPFSTVEVIASYEKTDAVAR